MTRSNPLLETRGLPRFNDIRAEDVEPALDEVLATNRARIAATLDRGSATWDDLGETLIDCEDHLERAWGPARHLHAVRDEPALREAYNATLPRVTEYATELSQNPRLFLSLRTLHDDPSLSAEQRRWIANELTDFRLGGAELARDEQRRFAAIRKEMAELSATFGEHVLDATSDWALVLSDPAELEGLPASAVDAAAEAAGEPERWRFTLHMPSFQPFMTFAASRERRLEMYRAYSTRASTGKLDNGPIIDRILELRREAAGLLGYAHWGERSLVKKMARSVEEVFEFLEDLARRSREAARRELEAVQALARSEGGPDPLEAWDILYWSERLRQREHDFSEEEVRAYFPIDAALDGLFAVARRLYGLRITPAEAETWHPDVRFWEVWDADGELRGAFYTDLYARDGKRGGAWMDPAISRRQLPDRLEIPVAYLVCNFQHPTSSLPSLLTHHEVSTLFHEFGHCLHHVLTRVGVPGIAGIEGVAWDAVELPSQMHENWVWQADALSLFARHYESGEPLPDELLGKLTRSRTFQAGMQMVRQLEFALFDMRLHTGEPGDVQACLDRVRNEVAVVIPPAWNRFQNSFGHIFGGGYAAGYYSYKWAEVLAADAFSKFEERGTFDRDTGAEFMRCILERGGSEDAADLYERFRGRPPTIDALLRQNGIA